MLVHVPLVLAVDHLPAPRQQHDHVGLVLADRVLPLVRPGLVGGRPAGLDPGDPPHAERRVVARPHELDLGPVDDAAAEDPLVGEHVAVLVLHPSARPGPTPRVRATESPKRSTLHRRAARRASGGGVVVVVVDESRSCRCRPGAPCWRRPSSPSWPRSRPPGRRRRRRARPARPATG